MLSVWSYFYGKRRCRFAKKAILLTSCGTGTHQLFKGLTAPAKPVEKTFDELVTLMANHQNPKRNPIAERFQFNMWNKKTVHHSRLRRLSQYCEYSDSLDSILRDRLVCGINHDRTQQSLLSEKANLSLEKVMDISLSLESAIKQAAAIRNECKQPNETVSKIGQKTPSRNQSAKCFRCDNPHNPKSCPFIGKECFLWQK